MASPWRDETPVNKWVIAAIVWGAVGVFLAFWLTGDNTVNGVSTVQTTTTTTEATTTTTAPPTTTTAAPTTTTTTIPAPLVVEDLFVEGSPELATKADSVLVTVQDQLEQDPNLKVRVKVFAQDRSEIWLSQERAETVVNHLVANGIDPARLSAEGRSAGSTLGEVAGDDDDGRTEFVFKGL